MMGWIVSSSVLIAAVALLRRALRGRISLRLQYALWALVLLRLLVPFQFGSTLFSVGNLAERVGEQPAVQFVSEMSQLPLPRMSYRAAYGQVAAEYAQKGVDIAEMTPEEYSRVDSQITDRMLGDVTPADVLRWVWLAGGAALALTFLACNLRFARRLKRSRQRLEDIQAPLPVYLCGTVETPCLFGLLRPAVYLTPEAAADETVLRHALAHETTHFRHGDHVWSLLRCLCLAVHWYNPLVWLAASLSRRDGELACDEGTLARLGEAERAAYGNTLIDLTCGRRAGTSLFYTATTMGYGKKQLKERIMLIAKKPHMLTATAVAVLLIAAVAVGCTFTGGRGEAEKPPEGSDAPSGPVTTGSPGESASPAPSRQLPWDSGQQREPLSYEEYFSQLRTYREGDVIWGWNMEGAELESHGSVLHLIDTSTGEVLWDIIALEDCIWATADENWIYGISDRSELVRMDYYGQDIQTLFTDKTGLLRALAESEEGFAPVYLADGCTLFFFAGTNDAIGVYRLYLPERKLDVLYDAIPVDAIRLSLAAPVSNTEIRWSRGNPDFFAQYKALTSDPASGYDPAQMGESECIGMLELDSGMFSACECYFNAMTQAYYEMPFGYVYLPMPRTQENIASHGDAWWLDFAEADG